MTSKMNRMTANGCTYDKKGECVMKAKKRITAMIMALVLMMTVQPLYSGIAVAATIAIPNGCGDYSGTSGEYSITDISGCTSINIGNIDGTGNTLTVSGTNTISGSVGNNLTIKLSKAKWGTPMLHVGSLEGTVRPSGLPGSSGCRTVRPR